MWAALLAASALRNVSNDLSYAHHYDPCFNYSIEDEPEAVKPVSAKPCAAKPKNPAERLGELHRHPQHGPILSRARRAGQWGESAEDRPPCPSSGDESISGATGTSRARAPLA